MTGASAIEVVEYDDRWEAAQTEFARRNWPGKHRRSSPEYVRWEYRGTERGPVPGVLLAVEGDKVVGQLGMIPGQARVGNDTVPIQWIGNLMVDPDYRRRGISSAIFQVALARPVVTLGTDPSPSAAATMSTVGFSRADSSALMVLPLSAGTTVTTRYPRLRRAKRLMDVVGDPAIRLVNRNVRRAQRNGLAQVCTWRDTVADVESSERNTTAPGSLHDEEFLRWRCGGFAPWVRQVDAVRTPNGAFALLERAGERMLVLHWHADTAEETAAIMGRTAYIAGAYGAAYLQAMATDQTQVERLRSLGFRARRTPTDLWAYPAQSIGTEQFVVQGYDTDQNL